MRRTVHKRSPAEHASREEPEQVLLRPSSAMRVDQAPATPELIRHLQRAGNAAVAAHLRFVQRDGHKRPKVDYREEGEPAQSGKKAKHDDDEDFNPDDLPPEQYEPDEYDKIEGFGNSSKLAANRFDLKGKARKDPAGRVFKTWKQGYEAQHIIPGAVFRDLDVDGTVTKDVDVNAAWNGMMLPSGRPGASAILYKTNLKGAELPRHIKKGLAHPTYNNAVANLLRGVQRRIPGRKWTLPWLQGAADYLRAKTKALKDPQNPRAVDDIQGLDASKVIPRR